MSNYNISMKRGNAIALLSRITDKANRLIVRELKAHGIEGIVPSHGSILAHLLNGGIYTMNDLARKIHRTKPTVTVLVDKLVEMGYVTKEKSNEDNRVTFISLTDKGLSLMPGFMEISEKMNTLVYKDFTDSEAELFESVLIKILRNLE